MIPERNQPDANQAGQTNGEQPDTQATSQKYRPDWIIPDNGTSSRNNHPSERNNSGEEESHPKSSIPMNNEDTLGIP